MVQYILWAWCSIGKHKVYPVYYTDPICSGVTTTTMDFKTAKRFKNKSEAEKIKKNSKTAWNVDTDELKNRL